MTVPYCHYGKYQLEITLVHETKKGNVTYTRQSGTCVGHPYYKLTSEASAISENVLLVYSPNLDLINS